MHKIDELLSTYKKENMNKNECPSEITLEMLVDYFKQPKDEYDDKNKLWKILYHIIYELDEFGFAYNTPSEKEFIKKIQNIQ